MSELYENYSLPEFVRQIQSLVQERQSKGAASSAPRIAESTKIWIWNEGRKVASPDMQELLLCSKPDSLKSVVGLRIEIDNSLRPFQFVVL